MASKDPEFEKMRKNGISVYPEVFKKADMLKLPPEVIVKELKKSANINFEKDSYAEIQEVVKTIVHNHMNSSAPMDVDKKGLHNLEQKVESCTESQDGQEGFGSRPEDQAEEQCLYDEEGGFLCYIGKSGQGSWQSKGKGKGKGKGKFQGECFNCGKVGHRSNDCWSPKVKGKGKGESKGYQQSKGDGYSGWHQKGGKGKGLHTFDQQGWSPFAPQPQPLQQQPQYQHQRQQQPPQPQGPQNQNKLMSTSPVTCWNGNNYAGNSGGLNLFSLERKSKAVTVTSNMFQDLSREDEGEIDDASKETWPTPKESKKARS